MVLLQGPRLQLVVRSSLVKNLKQFLNAYNEEPKLLLFDQRRWLYERKLEMLADRI